MSGVWDGMNLRASEFRGTLRIFSYACEVLASESRRLFDPEFTSGILDSMAERGDRDALRKIGSTDKTVNELLSGLIALSERQFTEAHKERIGQGCFFIGMLAYMILNLSDRDVLRLARMNVQQPRIEELKTNPCQAIDAFIDHLAPKLPQQDVSGLRDVLHRWNPQWADAQLGSRPRTEEATPVPDSHGSRPLQASAQPGAETQ